MAERQLEIGTDFAGYRILHLLGEGAKGYVYKAEKNSKIFALKILKTESTSKSSGDLMRFRRETASVARISHPNLIQIFDFSDSEGLPYIAMELAEGQNLTDVLKTDSLKINDILAIATALASGLIEVHNHGLLHRDIKPDNIMVKLSAKPDEMRVKLIDFGLGAEMDDSSGLSKTNEVVGTLTYSAPEQLGILKRLVDGRSDLYALGSVLYECLTGQPPFQADTATAILQMHATAQPPPLCELNPDVPPRLAEIVHKLLRKDPDDRYQSAAGLKFDLEHFSEITELGTQDLSAARHFQLPIYGRDAELKFLHDSLRTVEQGRGQTLVVIGDGGSGKSRLTRELVKTAMTNGFSLFQAKCSSLEMDKPLSAFRQMFDRYVHDVQLLPEVERKLALSHLRRAAGESTSLLMGMSEGLREVLKDEASSSQSLSDAPSDQGRFEKTVAAFVFQIANLNHKLLILIDDVQWLDESSRSLLGRLSLEMEAHRVLTLTTARSDAQSADALLQFKLAMKSSLAAPVEVRSLDLESSNQLVQKYLGGHEVETEVVKKLYSLSGGNPFMLTEYLSGFVSSGCLQIHGGKWSLEESGLDKLSLSQNVFDIVLLRFRKLSAPTQSLLSLASIVGFDFQSDFLAKVSNQDPVMVRDLLSSAIRENVLESTEPGTYRFVHDRIREAVVSGMDPLFIQKTNEQIAACLVLELAEERQAGQTQSIRIYDLARYHSAGRSEGFEQKIFDSNARAGKLALQNFAYPLAYNFFRAAAVFEQFEKHSAEFQFEFWRSFAQVCIILGKNSDAVEYLESARLLARTPRTRASLSVMHAEIHLTSAQVDKSIDSMVEALAALGQTFRMGPISSMVEMIFDVLRTQFLLFSGWGWGRLRKKGLEEKYQEYTLASETLELYSRLSYFQSRIINLAKGTFKQYQYAHALGDSVQLVKAHLTLGVLYAHSRIDFAADFHIRKANQMADRLNDSRSREFLQRMQPVLSQFMDQPVRAMKESELAVNHVIRSAGAYETATFLADYISQYFLRGYYKESLEKATAFQPVIDGLQSMIFRPSTRSLSLTPLFILGRVAEAIEMRKDFLYLVEQCGKKASFVEQQVPIATLVSAFEQEEFGPDFEAAVDQFLNFAVDEYHNRFVYRFICYARLAQWERAQTPAEKAFAKKRFEKVLGIFRWRALTAIESCHYWILRAAQARHAGHFKKAQKFLERAEPLAAHSDSVEGQYRNFRERALLERSRNLIGESDWYARKAYDLAIKHGWALRAAQTQRDFNLELRNSKVEKANLTATLANADLKAGQDSRITSALLRVGLASSLEVDGHKQVAASLDEIIKVMSAERAYIFGVEVGHSELVFRCGRDSSGADLEQLKGYSSTVVRKVAETSQPMIVTGSDEMEAIGSRSAVMHGLRSIMAVPLMLRGELKGVAYVDSSVAKGLFNDGDVEVFTAIANQISISFESLRMMNVEATKREMQKDLAVGAIVQKMLFPKAKTAKINRIEISGFYRPATQCGGDWWWFEAKPENLLWLFVGDVTGHGAGPAMITSSVAACFKMLGKIGSKLSLREATEAISHTLFEITNGDLLVSSAAIEVNTVTGDLQLWNAGSPGLFLFRGDGSFDHVTGYGTLMGFEEFEVQSTPLKLQPKDRIVIPTDGILEMLTLNGSALGVRKFIKLVASTNHLPIPQAIEVIIAELDRMRGEHLQDDDITLVILECSEPA